jgi:D-aminoacyl-tRNA deacylase
MRVLVQRVRSAGVSVDGASVASIGRGLLALCGVSPADTDADRTWLSRKIVSLRIFDDDAGIMNRSIAEVGGELLAVS